MMAGLFLAYTLVFISLWLGYRKLTIGLIAAGLVLCFFMLWHHATDMLRINW